MDLREELNLRFTRHLVATPKGRAHILNQVAGAESSDEGRVFERLRSKVDDPALARLIAKHEADEVRHAELFYGRLRATGIDPGPVPAHLKVLDRIDKKLGAQGSGFFDRPIETSRDIMESYLVLQVVEERALHQFAILERAFREVDVETADVFVEVGKDEERHLKYCHAISKRYAPTEAIRLETLARFRLLEAEAFRDNSAENMRHVLDNIIEPIFVRAVWGLIGAISASSKALPFTKFARAKFEGSREVALAA